MLSNNGLMNDKNLFLSFINKGILTLLIGLLLITMIPCSYLIFVYWSEMPILVKIFFPILFLIIFISMIIIPFNGMMIMKSGNIIFFPDFRLKKFNMEDLKRIAFNFNEWENNKYSVTIKIIYKDGGIFVKDYSKQFRNMKNKKMAMSIYTIKRRNVDRICEKLLDLDICILTIINKDNKITYQNK